jgi:hypothetical protein
MELKVVDLTWKGAEIVANPLHGVESERCHARGDRDSFISESITWS